jgi:tRNA modification GTPase
LRASDDPVELMGIARALDRASAADVRVFLTDGDEVPLMTPVPGDLSVRGKADLHPGDAGLHVSGKTGLGVAELLLALTTELSGRVAGSGILIRERQRIAVSRATGHLDQALTRLDAAAGAELVAEELRQAIAALDSLVGRVDVEHLLDVIFSSFCIGK